MKFLTIKQSKYSDLIADSIMLHNVVDLMEALSGMATEGHKLTKELIGRLSPFIREHIRRFGRYDVDMEARPQDLKPSSVPIT
ncbi:TPA: Tn3 family transposase [Vibrio parahaemolyticus]